jgi:mono/diheme cytochrome c family protein
MATGRRLGWGAFFAGVLAAVVVAIAVGAIVIFGGFYPVAASDGDPVGVGALLTASMDHGVERGARGLKAPHFTGADVRLGGAHFKGMCQECHGAPGVDPEEFATAMNPRPPDLAKATDDLSVEQVFWIVKHGIKMTGMPAFGKTEEEDDLWKVAAFVKQLPRVSSSDYASLPNAHENEHEHGAAAGEMAGDKH